MARAEYVENIRGCGDCDIVGSHKDFDHKMPKDHFDLVYIGEVPSACPTCGGPMQRHGKRKVAIAHTPVSGRPTQLHIEFPRYRCPGCGYMWKPAIRGVDEAHKMTEAAYVAIAQNSLRHTFREVARNYPFTHVTVKNVFEEFMDEYAERLRFEVPAYLGIDEKNLKRIGMVTVITDLEHRTVFDMIQGRAQKDLGEYFSDLQGLEKMRWVSSDMYCPFWKSIAKYTPNATWVIDHFHVVRGANEALEQVRKSLQSKLDRKGRLELKKDLTYALRKRTRDLTPYEAASLYELRKESGYEPLMAAYDLKEDFFDIYDAHPTSKEDAEKAFESWRKFIPKDAIYEPFRILAKTVLNHYEYIFNYWDCPSRISNGYAECANRLIKETDMRGRGHSFKVLRARTLYRRQNLERIVRGENLSIGPRVDTSEPLFITEPVGGDVFVDPPTGVSVDVGTGEIPD